VFERYTESARRALFFARYETSNFGSLQIEPEHLLLGLLRQASGLTQRLYADAGLTYKAAVAEIRKQHPPAERVSTSVEIPFSESGTAALHAAAREAEGLGHDYIGTEHLLLGLLYTQGTTAKGLLESHGIRLDDVRQRIEVLTVLGEAEGGSPRAPEAVELDLSRIEERLLRVQELLDEIEEASEGNARVIELVAAIEIELADLRSRQSD
jgi:ATP-dependent Clp protease ATP-binding subunit ClpC